jgi:hypothetical protein
MNAHAAHPGRWPFLGFALAGAIAVGLTAGLVGGVLSRTLVLDLLALWPLAALVVVGGALAWAFRRRRPRLIAVPGLVLFSWLVVGLALHLSGFDWLPSSAGDVVRSAPIAEPRARLVADLNGALPLHGSAQPGGYSLVPMRAGGEAGVPEALEQTTDGVASIVAVEREDSQWFRFRGWEAAVDPGPEWQMQLESGEADLDLTALRVASVDLTSPTGSVTLGAPLPTGSSMAVDGDVTITVPASAPVTASGPVELPEGWEATDTGGRAPEEGTGWVIEVAPDAHVTIRTS